MKRGMSKISSIKTNIMDKYKHVFHAKVLKLKIIDFYIVKSETLFYRTRI